MTIIGWSGHNDSGVWWVGLFRWRAILKAPWNEPLFSERYGHVTKLRLPGGWRILFRTVPRY